MNEEELKHYARREASIEFTLSADIETGKTFQSVNELIERESLHDRTWIIVRRDQISETESLYRAELLDWWEAGGKELYEKYPQLFEEKSETIRIND